MKTSSCLYDIPILKENGTNFQMWKYQICTVLNIHGLLNIAEEKEQHPSQILVTGTGDDAAKAHTVQIEKIKDSCWVCCWCLRQAQPLIWGLRVPDDCSTHRQIFCTTFMNDSPFKPQSLHSSNTQPLSHWFLRGCHHHPLSSQNILHPKDHPTLHPKDKLSSDVMLGMVCTWGWKSVELAWACTECRNSCNELGDADLSEWSWPQLMCCASYKLHGCNFREWSCIEL